MKLRDGIDKKIGNFEFLDKDTLITPFITKSYCDYLISEFEKIGWIHSQISSNLKYFGKIQLEPQKINTALGKLEYQLYPN